MILETLAQSEDIKFIIEFISNINPSKRVFFTSQQLVTDFWTVWLTFHVDRGRRVLAKWTNVFEYNILGAYADTILNYTSRFSRVRPYSEDMIFSELPISCLLCPTCDIYYKVGQVLKSTNLFSTRFH